MWSFLQALLQDPFWLAELTVAFFHILVGQDGFEDLSVEQEMHSCFRKAAVNLKEIIKIPGVWDLFVKCYVDVRAYFYRYLPLVFPCLIFIKMSVCSFVICVWVTTKCFKSDTSIHVSHCLWFRAQFTPGRTAEPAQSTKKTLSVHCQEKEIDKQLAYFVFMVLVQKLEHSCFV